MSTFLEAWRSRQPLPKETVLLLMREFALRCLESAYRSLGLKDEEIHRLLKGGRNQSNYRQVAVSPRTSSSSSRPQHLGVSHDRHHRD